MLASELDQQLGQPGFRQLFNFVGDTNVWLVDLDDSREIDRCGDDYQVARCTRDGFFEFVTLHGAIPHGRQQAGQVGVTIEGAADRADSIGPGID